MQGLYPVALALMVAQNLDPVVAWAKAIVRERKLCGPAACQAAAQIIVRGLAWAFSTSDVERLFHGGMIDDFGGWFDLMIFTHIITVWSDDV